MQSLAYNDWQPGDGAGLKGKIMELAILSLCIVAGLILYVAVVRPILRALGLVE